MASFGLKSGSTHGPKNETIPKHVWMKVRYEVTQLYMTEGKTLKKVMSYMRLNGFTATKKQYKTQFEEWGLRKYRRTSRPRPAAQDSVDDETASIAASNDMPFIFKPRRQLASELEYQQGDDIDSSLPHTEFHQQQTMTEASWLPQPGSFPYGSQFEGPSSMLQPHENGYPPHMRSLPQNSTTTVSGILSHCDKDLTQTILLPEDITEIERVLDVLGLVGSAADAFKIAQALLMHIAATPQYGGQATAHLARTAVTVVRNASALHNCNQIMNHLNVAIHSGANFRSSDSKFCRLLFSFFGLVLRGSAGATSQQSLALCHAAVLDFGRFSSLETLDWRYLVLITNIKQVSTASNVLFDSNTAWKVYYKPRTSSAAVRNIDSYLERLIMWCTAVLDDAGSWGAFKFFSADLWTLALEPAHVSEMECKALFCYLCSCLQSNSHMAPHSECHVLLQEALAGLQQHLDITPWECLNAISRISMLSNAQPYFGDNRLNLVYRALCRLQGVRSLRPPLGILAASGWAGSSLSATFLESLALQYCQPYRFSNRHYEQRVDAQVRDFLDRHLALGFSMNAFMHNPSAREPPMSDDKGMMAASLIDLMMYEKLPTQV